MKLQDVGFLIILTALILLKKNPKWFVVAGLACLVLSMPLFHFWIFFTAQRLIWYAVTFFTLAILFLLINQRKDSR